MKGGGHEDLREVRMRDSKDQEDLFTLGLLTCSSMKVHATRCTCDRTELVAMGMPTFATQVNRHRLAAKCMNRFCRTRSTVTMGFEWVAERRKG